MKARLGFVTNSSSSSFIFSKDSIGLQELSKEILFNWLKGIIEECREQLKVMLELASSYSITWDADEEDLCDNGALLSHMNRKSYNVMNFERELLRMHRMYIDDLHYACEDFMGTAYPEKTAWTEYESYEEYVNKDNSKYGRVIDIIDYRSLEADRHDNGETIQDIDWFKCDSEDIKNKLEGQATLRESALCLGDMAVHSENGRLPNMFVDKISEYCTLACGHMG